MKRIRLVAIVLTIIGGNAIADTRSPAAGRQQGSANAQAPSVFRAGVELVRLDVRVVDDQGRPVRDLAADEIEIEEGGQKRPIVLFQHVAAPPASYLEAARRTIGAEVSTNQGAPRGHLYVFVFDQHHITPGNEQRARAAVDRFVRTRVRPGDRVALYAIPGPGPQLPFSGNTTAALAELPKVRGMLDREVAVGVAPMNLYEAYQISRGDQAVTQRVLTRASEGGTLDITGRPVTTQAATGGVGSTGNTGGESLTRASQIVVDAARGIVSTTDGQARAFLMTLSDIVRELAAIEGRKSVLLVSEGFYADNVGRDVDRLAAAAAQAYAVIYSFDINRRGSDVGAAAPSGGEPAAEIQSRLESLGALAAETSGELIVDSGAAMDRTLSRIADSSQDYYIVGFEPPASALEDRQAYRRVKVGVKRAGARVTSRTGYSLREAPGPADRRRSIDAALGAPFPQQGLPLQMTTYVLRGTSPGSQRVFLSLEAELPVGSTEANRADVVFVARSATDGRVMASGTDSISLPATAGGGRTTGPSRFNVQFELPAGEYVMRAVVREPGGATGTVDRRFEVRSLDGVDITASDLIIGRYRDRLPVRPAAYVEEGLVGALEVYARNAAELGGASVTVDLFAVGGETPVRSVRADLGPTRSAGTGGVRSAGVEMPLAGVTPGDYVARATVRANEEVVSELMRQVQVLPGRSPVPAAPAAESVTPAMIVTGELGRRFVANLRATSGDPMLERAAAQASLGDWDASLALLGNPSPSQPAAVHALRGLTLFALGRVEAARESMERAWALDGRSALTAFFLGWVRNMGGHEPDAISAWRAAIALDPTMVSAYLALADTYVRLRHPELAAQVLRAGLARMPDSAELQIRLSEVER